MRFARRRRGLRGVRRRRRLDVAERRRRDLARTGIGRDLPQVGLVVEGRRVGHVVRAVHVGLRAEEVLREPQVLLDRVGHLREAREQLRERGLVRLDHRVLRVDDVEVDRAVVRVDGRLHRVAHVVERAVEPAGAVEALRVRVLVARRVAVEHPDQPTVRDHRVRVGVVVQERRGLLDPVEDVAQVQHLGLRRDLARDQDVEVVEPQRERGAAQPARELDATGARVAVEVVAGALLRVVELLGLRVDEREAGEVLAEVDLGPVERDVALGRDVAQQVVGLADGAGRVARRHDRAVPVRVHEVPVDPGLAREVRRVELARGDQRLHELAVDHVAVDVRVGELVEGLQRLEQLEVAQDHRRVPEARVLDRRRVVHDRLRGQVLLVGEALDRDLVEVERVTGRVDVALRCTAAPSGARSAGRRTAGRRPARSSR